MSTTQGIPRTNLVCINEPYINGKVSMYKFMCIRDIVLALCDVYNIIIPISTCSYVIVWYLRPFYLELCGSYGYGGTCNKHCRMGTNLASAGSVNFVCSAWYLQYKYEWAVKEIKAFHSVYLHLSLNLFKFIHIQ